MINRTIASAPGTPPAACRSSSRRTGHPETGRGERLAAWKPNGIPDTSRTSLAYRLRTTAASIVLAALAGCAGWPPQNDTPDSDDLLRNSLTVAAAALAAGQLDVARRLYLSLADRFDDAPEPPLGLGYVAFQSEDFPGAEKFFLQAAERASDAPATQAEALLGAGRTALVQGRTRAARRHFRRAQASGQDTPAAAWIANGLAVVATLDARYARAEAHYAEALRLSSGHPRVAANHVRMLLAAGRIDDASRGYAKHPPSYWAGDDGPALSLLVEESRRNRHRQALASRPAGARDAAATVSEGQAGGTPLGAGRDAQPLAPPDPVPGRSEPGDTDSGAQPRLLDPSLAIRLSVRSRDPAQPSAQTPHDAGIMPADHSRLILRVDGWPDRRVDGESDPRVDGGSDLGVDGGSDPPTPAPTLSATSSSGAGAPAARPDTAAPARGVTMPQAGAPLPTSTPSVPGVTTALPPIGGTATSGAALPHSLPDSEEPVVAPRDASSAPTLALTLGQSRRLHLERNASSVLVASPDIADVRLLAPDVVYVIGKGVGRTSVAVLDADEQVDEWTVSVALDLEPVRTVLAAAPGLDSVLARRLTRGVALTGAVASAADADRALRLAAGALPEGVPIENELRVAAPQQVNLEVQIAEVQRSVTEDLGVNWEAFGIRNSTQFGFRIGRVPLARNGLGLDAFPPALFDGNLASSIVLASEGGRGRFRAMIDALATAGLANVLARPNVTAVSGESASFFSGGEFPLPTGFDDGVLVFTYKKYGVLLDFVPTVVDTGRIVLTVRPEVSEPSLNQSVTVVQGVEVPVINVRRAETTVEVADGESIVIAGLFRNRSNTVEAGVPVVKDVPLLGALFGHTSARSEELELIVVVTARLVEAYTDPGDTDAPPATLQAEGYHY